MDVHTTATGPLLAVAALWGFAVVLPGPNFMVTARYAVSRSRHEGMQAVCGILAATVVWAAAGFFGIHALFTVAPWTYLAIKVAGGGYLMYLGARLVWGSVRGKKDGDGQALGSAAPSQASAFRMGVMTTLTNPKSAVFVASVFASALPAHPSPALGLLAMMVMVAISLLWYSAVAFLFATKAVSSAYRRGRGWMDRIAGGFFILFGAKLASDH